MRFVHGFEFFTISIVPCVFIFWGRVGLKLFVQFVCILLPIKRHFLGGSIYSSFEDFLVEISDLSIKIRNLPVALFDGAARFVEAYLQFPPRFSGLTIEE